MFQLKIVMIGPPMSGKTTIANFLSDSVEHSGGEYRPTQGVRIVEFETQNLNVKNSGLKAEIELWDCSGNLKFEALWPAIYRDANGVVFVYEPTTNDCSSKLDHYFESFVNQSGNSGINNYKNCLLIEHVRSDVNQHTILSDHFSRLEKISVNVEDGGEVLRSGFNKFIIRLLSGVRDRNEQDELNILTGS